MSGLYISANRELLPVWSGPLSGAFIPVWDANGNPYQIAANNVLVGDDDVLTQVSATEGDTTNIPSLHDKILKFVFRGGGFAGKVVPGTDPAAAQAGWDNTNNNLTCPPGQPWTGGEILTIIHKP